MGKSYSAGGRCVFRRRTRDNAILAEVIERILGSWFVRWIAIVIATVLFAPKGVAARVRAVSPSRDAHPTPPQKAQVYDPMRAVHDVEVGKFYMRRGDIDGAIARFKDAILYKDDYAEPRLQLGYAYEKKGSPKIAIRYFKEYLKILPGTPESKKVRARIAKLQEEIKKETSGKKD
jgi:Tfp pilus assembly protein PilF